MRRNGARRQFVPVCESNADGRLEAVALGLPGPSAYGSRIEPAGVAGGLGTGVAICGADPARVSEGSR